MADHAAAIRERAESLRKFQAEARSAEIRTDSEFQRIFREAQAVLEMSDQEIADALSVSRPTVNRWVNGKNLPYYAMRKPILTWIGEQLTTKIRRLGASGRNRAASGSGSLMCSPTELAAKNR